MTLHGTASEAVSAACMQCMHLWLEQWGFAGSEGIDRLPPSSSSHTCIVR